MTDSSLSRFDSNAEIKRGLMRSRLVMEMTQECVQIAVPARYSGIDILAYTLPLVANSIIQAVPIQLATMSYGTFLHDFANWRTSGLLVVLLSDEREPQHVITFALSAAELMLVQRVGFIDSKEDAKRDVVAQASALRRALEPYCMVSAGWRTKISRWLVERQARSCGRSSYSVDHAPALTVPSPSACPIWGMLPATASTQAHQLWARGIYGATPGIKHGTR